MPVPLLDVNAQNLPLETELTAAFQRVLRSGQFIMGPDVAAIEGEIAQMAGVKHAIGVSSGTDAILLALIALEIGPWRRSSLPFVYIFCHRRLHRSRGRHSDFRRRRSRQF